MVHLMSAGRLKYVASGAKGAKTPMFRLRFADGGELQLTEAGSKKRAGVWLLRPDAVAAELAHLGPEADQLSTDDVARILAGDSRRLHSLLRDQRLIAGIGRAWANEILWAAQALAVRALDAGGRRGDRAPRRRDPRGARTRPRAAARRREGRRRLPDPQRARPAMSPLRHAARPRRLRGAHDLLLPVCQTGGRMLKDRRLSRLLKRSRLRRADRADDSRSRCSTPRRVHLAHRRTVSALRTGRRVEVGERPWPVTGRPSRR